MRDAIFGWNMVLFFDNYKLNVTISSGVVGYNRNYKSVNDIIKDADIALYQSKESGRNRSTLCSKENKKDYDPFYLKNPVTLEQKYLM